MLYYCDKCGNLGDEFDNRCYCCDNSPLKPIPREYIDNFRWRDGDGKQAFIEEVVKKSPNLDQYLFEHKDEIIEAKNEDMNAKMAIGKAYAEKKNNIPKCPYCQSTNTQKITAASKIANIALFGVFGNKRKHQWHCNNCGSNFG